jgi:hydrogenase expression/formation protein HypD
MKFIEEYRDPAAVHALAAELSRIITRPWTLMEVCGGQTHAILRFGIDRLLPPSLRLIHGPGCPVCVTPAGLIDQAVVLARRPEVILCSFGDMLRVPGRHGDLLLAKAAGGDVRIVYSPMDALALARQNPDREVVFFAIGFETTAPANAMAAHQARATEIHNFSLLVSQVLVGPAMDFILRSPGSQVQGFLAAGHAAAVTGVDELVALSNRHRVPVVVTGFEPVDLMDGILHCVRQLEDGRAELENAYSRAVRPAGNSPALTMTHRVFKVVDREWRGLGLLPASGLGLRAEYAEMDAALRFSLGPPQLDVDEECLGGQVMLGTLRPHQCPAFGTRCKPEHPLGAPMVSSEGACAAYFRFRGSASAGGD